jgi:hypothetical protein
MLKILCSLIPLLLLAACKTTHYEYTTPASDAGRFCITQCAGIKEQCVGNEYDRAQHEKSRCEHSSDNIFKVCMGKAKTKDDEKQCDKKRNICGAYENTDRCEANYRACYVDCGGQVQELTQ